MIYRQPRNGKNFWRSKSYKFTVASKEDKSLIALKNTIAKQNAAVRKHARTYSMVTDYDKLYTVRLMARGPRRWHTKFKGSLIRYFKGANGIPQTQKLLHGNADSNLNHKFAEEFDVYVHHDTQSLDKLRTEIETGQAPGVQRKIEMLKNKIWRLEYEAKQSTYA
jgi:hypothetical protein